MSTSATSLIRATTVGEPKVETPDGASVGSVHAYLIDKRAGRCDFAVLSLGGFLGMNKSFYPVPFPMLDYDPVRDVYVTVLDRKRLEGGPSWSNTIPTFDQPYADRVASYYRS